MRQFDTSGKQSIHLFVRAWADWLLEQQHIEVVAELSSEFLFVARSTDVLLKVKGVDGKQFLALIELQTRHDANMPRRLTAYAALAREKYQLDVYVIVIYLLPPPKKVQLSNHFHSEFMGQTAHQDFNLIRLWEVNAREAFALQNPGLLPFVPLMRGGDTAESLRICVERIRELPEAEDIEPLLIAFASLVMDPEVVKKITRWSMYINKDSPFYRDLAMPLEEAIAEARIEAHASARAEAKEEERLSLLNTLGRFLTYRFAVAESHFSKRFALLSLDTLKQLMNAAFDVNTLTEFEQKLIQSEKTAQT